MWWIQKFKQRIKRKIFRRKYDADIIVVDAADPVIVDRNTAAVFGVWPELLVKDTLEIQKLLREQLRQLKRLNDGKRAK